MNSDHAPTAEERLLEIESRVAAELYKPSPAFLAYDAAYLLRENREKDAQLAKAERSRKHTQEWYASHYGKLEDWARKILPDRWRKQFFHCVANGTYGHEDVGERYRCNAGFDVVPSGYIHMDDAKGQLVIDQTRRAEEAEVQLAEKGARIAELTRKGCEVCNVLGNLGIHIHDLGLRPTESGWRFRNERAEAAEAENVILRKRLGEH